MLSPPANVTEEENKIIIYTTMRNSDRKIGITPTGEITNALNYIKEKRNVNRGVQYRAVVGKFRNEEYA